MAEAKFRQEPKSTLISIRQAAARGVERVHGPQWAGRFDHFKIDIVDGQPGPWLHLFAPFNLRCNGRDPVDLLTVGRTAKIMHLDCDAEQFEPYTGPIAGSDEYQHEVARFAKLWKEPR